MSLCWCCSCINLLAVKSVVACFSRCRCRSSSIDYSITLCCSFVVVVAQLMITYQHMRYVFQLLLTLTFFILLWQLCFKLTAPIICSRTATCCCTYIWAPTSWWCCCIYRVVSYDPSVVVASFVATLSRCCCWANLRTVGMSGCVCFCPFVVFVFSCFVFFVFSLCYWTVGCTFQCAFNISESTRTAYVAIPMSTHESCCCCTYDLWHSRPWRSRASSQVSRSCCSAS